MTQTALLQEIERFVASTGMGEAYFGRKAVNDGKLVARLRRGRPVETGTADKVRTYIGAEMERRQEEARRILAPTLAEPPPAPPTLTPDAAERVSEPEAA